MADPTRDREPTASGQLEVSDGQRIYWETVGSPTGVPVVYVHGGPGSGSRPWARQYFDPQRFRAVLYDQRGCGRSLPRVDDPAVGLAGNTTERLVDDLERLRESLSIERWIVLGVSWGVTLALVYAEAHPERVIALVLGAVTMGTPREIDWITRQMGRVFPRQWERFIGLVPEVAERGNIPAAYARRLASADAAQRDDAARHWCAWEDTHVSLMPGWTPDPRYADPVQRMVLARLVTHYWGHDCFLADDQILADVDRLADVPGWLIHGAHDISSPPDTAWRLARAWLRSTLTLLDAAGHGGHGFAEQLRAGLDRAGALA